MLPGFAEEIFKIAATNKSLELAKILGGSVLSFGLGTATGLGAGHLADKAYNKITGKNIPNHAIILAAPLLGTGAGIAYAIHKKKELEDLRRAFQDRTDSSGR